MNSMDLDVTDLVSPIYLKRLKNELGHLMKELERCGIFWITKKHLTQFHTEDLSINSSLRYRQDGLRNVLIVERLESK